MTSTLYVLTHKDKPTRYEPAPVGPYVVIPARTDFYLARMKAFRHAMANDIDTALIQYGGSEIWWRPCGLVMRQASKMQQHGMWLYMERLTRRFGHVYASPYATADAVPNHGRYLTPTAPLVAAYNVAALRRVANLDIGIGAELCAAGFDSYTVGDYFHLTQGEPVLDEAADKSTWCAHYAAYLRDVLGVPPRSRGA